ncbi:hypothetical protein J3F83DRAFT_614128 [Trichoderma novae-zelandiae]
MLRTGRHRQRDLRSRCHRSCPGSRIAQAHRGVHEQEPSTAGHHHTLVRSRTSSRALIRSQTCPNTPMRALRTAQIASKPAGQAQAAAATPDRAEHQCRASKTCARPASCVTLPETGSLALPLIPGSWTGAANGKAGPCLESLHALSSVPQSRPKVGTSSSTAQYKVRPLSGAACFALSVFCSAAVSASAWETQAVEKDEGIVSQPI